MNKWTTEFYVYIDESTGHNFFEEIKLDMCKLLLQYLINQHDVGRQISSLARKLMIHKNFELTSHAAEEIK